MDQSLSQTEISRKLNGNRHSLMIPEVDETAIEDIKKQYKELYDQKLAEKVKEHNKKT
jgi:hypothetical protein